MRENVLLHLSLGLVTIELIGPQLMLLNSLNMFSNIYAGFDSWWFVVCSKKKKNNNREKFFILEDEDSQTIAVRSLHLHLIKRTYDRCKRLGFRHWPNAYRAFLIKLQAKFPALRKLVYSNSFSDPFRLDCLVFDVDYKDWSRAAPWVECNCSFSPFWLPPPCLAPSAPIFVSARSWSLILHLIVQS